MDQRAHDVEEDLRRIVRTRVALSDKVETLERRVTEMAYDTKAVAANTVETAKDKAKTWADQAARRFQSSQRPWLYAGGAMALALLTGWIRRRPAGVYAYFPAKARGANVMPSGRPRTLRRGVHPFYSRPFEASPPAQSSGQEPAGARSEAAGRAEHAGSGGDIRRQLLGVWNEVVDEFAKEGVKLQHTFMEIGLAFLRDLTHIAGRTLVDQLRQGQPESRSTANELAGGRTESR